MRIVSYIFFGLGAIGLVLWVLFYGYVIGLACAYSGPNGAQCRTPMPWELRGDDLQILVLIPGLIVLALFVLAIVFRRVARRTRAG